MSHVYIIIETDGRIMCRSGKCHVEHRVLNYGTAEVFDDWNLIEKTVRKSWSAEHEKGYWMLGFYVHERSDKTIFYTLGLIHQCGDTPDFCRRYIGSQFEVQDGLLWTDLLMCLKEKGFDP